MPSLLPPHCTRSSPHGRSAGRPLRLACRAAKKSSSRKKPRPGDASGEQAAASAPLPEETRPVTPSPAAAAASAAAQPSVRPRGGPQPGDGSGGSRGPPPGSSGLEVPQTVSDRVLRRILLFAGVPVLAGVLLLPAFWYLKVKQQVDIPMWAVQVSTVLTFGAGFVGISYGALSSSWREKPGSLWGVAEARENFDALQKKDGR